MIHLAPDVGLKIFFVSAVDFGGDLQRHSGTYSDFNSAIDAFFRRDPAKKRQVLSRFKIRRAYLLRQAVMHSALPVDPRQRRALRIRDGDYWHIGKFTVKRDEIGKVEAAMQRCDLGKIEIPAKRKGQIVNMKVNDVELVLLLQHSLDEIHVMRQRIDAARIQT